MVMETSGTPNVRCQYVIPVVSLVIDAKINVRIDPKNIPIVINNC